MKKFFCALAILIYSSPLMAKFVRGRIVETTKITPVFKNASKNSERIAIAPEGTLLLLEQISPRKLWIQIRDVEESYGWVPLNRTDLLLFQKRSTVKKEKVIKANLDPSPKDFQIQKDLHDSGKSRHQVLSEQRFQLSPSARISFPKDRISEIAYGIKIQVNGPSVYQLNQNRRVGLETGILASHSELKNLLFPARFFMQWSSLNSPFFRQMDLGTLWEMSHQGSHFLSLSAGYTFGLRFGKDWALKIRPGIEVFSKTRFSVESSLSWSI